MRSLLVAALVLAAGSAVAGDIPDHTITPGIATDRTREQVCATRWGRDARHVTARMKREVLANYPGTKCRRDRHGRLIEIDHLISRELGGADDVKNLWPQCYAGRWNATMKDRVENMLHRDVCAGRIELKEAQTSIATDWRALWRRYFQQ